MLPLLSDARRRVAILLTGATLVIAACGGAGTSPSASTAPTSAAPASPTAAPPVTASPEPAAFPVTVTDDEGTAVEIAAEPQRIVSLTPANTEVAFALGAGDRIVATDSGSDTPAEAVDLPDVADFAAVDVEAVVDLEADLVLAGGLGFTPPDAIAQLRDLGIPVVVVYAPTIEAVFEDIELVGTAIGEGPAATELVAGIRAEMDAITAAVAGPAAGTAPRVFYEVGYTDATGEIFGPADDSFVAEMVARAGGDPITTGDPASYLIPLETLIEADPQLIVLGTNAFYMPTPEQVATRAGWDAMTAVKDGAIIPVEDTVITRPGPRLAEGLRNLAAAIRPDVTLPAAP